MPAALCVTCIPPPLPVTVLETVSFTLTVALMLWIFCISAHNCWISLSIALIWGTESPARCMIWLMMETTSLAGSPAS